MFEDTRLFGISMTSRSNRRVLVVVTYAVTAMVLAGFYTLMRFITAIPDHTYLKVLLSFLTWVPFFFVLFAIPGIGYHRGLFGRLVPEQTFSFKVPAVRTLGLSRGIPDEQPQGDEREMAVRNSAYFLSFKIVAWYAYLYLFLCVVPLVTRENEIARVVAFFAAIPLVIMLFTLPQAVILWMEPDLPEEVA